MKYLLSNVIVPKRSGTALFLGVMCEKQFSWFLKVESQNMARGLKFLI